KYLLLSLRKIYRQLQALLKLYKMLTFLAYSIVSLRLLRLQLLKSFRLLPMNLFHQQMLNLYRLYLSLQLSDGPEIILLIRYLVILLLVSELDNSQVTTVFTSAFYLNMNLRK